VNPPFREAAPAPDAPREQAKAPEPPLRRAVTAMAEDQGAGDDPGPLEAPGEPGESAPAGKPAPVHVPYARTGTEPDVVSVPPARGPRRPGRSPFWAAVHSHLWLVGIVVVLVGAAGTAYWGLRVHQRIGVATIERGVGGREHANTIKCVEQQSNGAVWACGLVYRAESVCLIANVNPVGDWTTKPGADLCTHRPELTALLPARLTSSAVAADLRSQFSLDVSRCAKIPTRKVRWACLGPGASSSSCLEVRIVPWTPWATSSSTACEHLPALRKFVGKGT
jgi:hypothetical protein